VEHQRRGAEVPGKKRNRVAHRGGRASVRWWGEASAEASRRRRMALEGGGSPASTLQVSEMTGQVRGGLREKSEEGCVWATVLSGNGGDGGAAAFREADRGGNSDISGGATGAARGRGRGELGGVELRWPLGVAGVFVEEKWRERGGGSRLGDGEAMRGKKKGGLAWWHVEEGGPTLAWGVR
jgi:hypothetical protein